MTELETQKIEAVADMMGDTPAGQIVRGAAKEIAGLRILLLMANRYVEGYAENENNHPQARDGARDLVRQIKEAT